MPTGPFGGPRPFAESELIYEARYNIDRGIGERLENNEVRENAERLIAQRVEDNTGFKDPVVNLAPAGFTLLIQVGLGNQSIKPTGRRTEGFGALRSSVDNGVNESIDENAERGVGIDDPEWEIRCK